MPTNQERFRFALFPAILMGFVTNVYISIVIYFVGGGVLILSPIVSTLLFLGFWPVLKKGLLNPNLVFYCLSLIVCAEVAIHTVHLGWETGFYYYIFLLPLVFLLNSKWKVGVIIVFNVLILVFGISLWSFQADANGIIEVSKDIQNILQFINLSGTASIVVVIMLYFSRALHLKDDELEAQNEEISAQNEHKQILLKEVHHRVKNNLQIITSLLSLQSRTVEDEEIVNVLEESKRRVEAIALIHQKLYQDDDITQVSFKSYLEEVVASQKLINPNIKYVVNSPEVNLQLDTAIPLGLVVSELISNSLKHAFSEVTDPLLTIDLEKIEASKYVLSIHDNGPGFPETFSFENETGLGSEIINALTGQLNSQVEYKNSNGAKVIIRFNEKSPNQ